MLKRIICASAALSLCLCLASCGGDKTAADTTVTDTTAEEVGAMDTGILPDDFSYSEVGQTYTDSSAESSNINVTYPVFESDDAVMNDINSAVYDAALDFQSFGGDLSGVTLKRSYTTFRSGDILSVLFDGEYSIDGGESYKITYSVMFNMATGRQVGLYDIFPVTYDSLMSIVEELYKDQNGEPVDSHVVDIDSFGKKLEKLDTELSIACTSYISDGKVCLIIPVLHSFGDRRTVEIPEELLK